MSSQKPEKIRVMINGVDQGMFLEGVGPDKPVLLFLHGGPGMPEFFLNKKYPTGLDRHFVVCWWEMRGAGLSYHPEMPKEQLTLEQLIDDTIEVARYLRDRFKRDKIFLMGHSGGSFIGIQAAVRAPELFHAYIGVGQMCHQIRSEVMAYQYMLKGYEEKGDNGMIRRLKETPLEMKMPMPERYLVIRDKAMHGLGIGTTRDMRSVFFGIFLQVWLNPYYTFNEKRAIWKGKKFSQGTLWNEMFSIDLATIVKKVDVPVYFCSGVFDYTVSYSLSKSFFEGLNAPVKGFYTFERSAHSPPFEEPEKMCEIMVKDVLLGKASMADLP